MIPILGSVTDTRGGGRSHQKPSIHAVTAVPVMVLLLFWLLTRAIRKGRREKVIAKSPSWVDVLLRTSSPLRMLLLLVKQALTK